jgi:RNA polymerase-binding transcription factor DksA
VDLWTDSASAVVQIVVVTDEPERSTRGATRMDARRTKHYERLLLTQRDRYLEALNRIEGEEAESQGISAGDAVRAKDVADAASDTQEEEKDFAVATRLSRRISEVDEALTALREAPERFGVCRDCGRHIERQRLELRGRSGAGAARAVPMGRWRGERVSTGQTRFRQS